MKRRIPSRCRICSHPELANIDASLAAHASIKSISTRWKVSIHALYRHQANHLSEVAKARILAGPDMDEADIEKMRTQQGAGLLREILMVRGRLYAWLRVAEDNKDGSLAAKITARIHDSFALTKDMVGELPASNINIVNILCAEPYLDLRNAIVKTLRSHPAAARAVASVLQKHEREAARQITLEAQPKEVPQ